MTAPAVASTVRTRFQSGPVVALLALFAACIVVFVAASVDITHNGPLARGDPSIAHWSYEHMRSHRQSLFAVTNLGNAGLLALLVVLAAALLIAAKRWLDTALLTVAAGTTAILTVLLKEAFHRDRPIYLNPLHGPRSFSFPSGHSSGAFTVYLLVAILFSLRASRRIRFLVIGAAALLATAIATSRVLIPEHFLSDVIAGSALGIGVVAAAMAVRVAYTRLE